MFETGDVFVIEETVATQSLYNIGEEEKHGTGKRLQMTGYTAFFLSGICAIVLSIVVRKMRNKEEVCTLS